MKFHKNKFLTTVGAAALALAVGACSSNGDSDDSANGAGEEELRLLQAAFGEDDLTPEAITALRAEIMMLMARADLTPAEVQALRDEIASLMVGTDITPADVQALRDQITMLMARADLTPAEVQALRDEITALMASTPAEIQALRDQITTLMARADITPADLLALRERIVTLNGEVADLMGRDEITPEAVQALRNEIASLNTEVAALMATTPAEIQDLRDQIVELTGQVATLMARPDITEEGAQALRNEIAILMLRATISQADYDALVAALGDMPFTVATLEMLVADYIRNKSAAVDEAAAEASARAAGLLLKIMTQTTSGDDELDAITVVDDPLMPFASLKATNTTADGVEVLLNAMEGESDFEEATDRAAPAINGWDHVLLAKEAGDDESTEYVAVYTDVDLPGPKSLLADEGVDLEEDTPALFFTVTDDPDGQGEENPLTGEGEFVKLAHTDMFPRAPATGQTTVVLGSLVTRPGTTTARLEFPGTWRDVPGTFICSTGACEVAANGIMVTAKLDDEGEEELTANFATLSWVFQPDDKAATADVADEDYLYFGWWKNEPAEETGDPAVFAYGFRTFASGSQPFTADGDAMEEVEGKATYTGAATGKYALEKGSRLAPQYEADAFTARASLTANFGDDDAAGTIKGTITDFVNANPAGTSLDNWEVTLNPITLGANSASFESTEVVEEPDDDNAVAEIGSVESSSGEWSGEFFGNGREDGQPGSVAGRFKATFTDANTHIAGSYGAHNVSPDEAP